jgi:hypothetical protein
MNLRKDYGRIASGAATAITTFWAIQEIAKNYGVTLTMPTNYILTFAFLALTAFPLWIGYQIHAWRIRREPAVKLSSIEPSPMQTQGIIREPTTGMAMTLTELHNLSCDRALAYLRGTEAKLTGAGWEKVWDVFETGVPLYLVEGFSSDPQQKRKWRFQVCVAKDGAIVPKYSHVWRIP